MNNQRRMAEMFSYFKYIEDGCHLLDDNADRRQIVLDSLAVFDKLRDSNFVIAVFAPFNYGKSTLLNALLGQKVLPINLVPTTGTTIRIKYGRELMTRITMSNGREIIERGTEILGTFAVLSEERKMRKDVASVEVSCPHPLLKNNVELVDIPGTNDMKEQNTLVQEQLLKSDLIIQVLNAQQLFTLNERENLREWLVNKGIKTVLFVVNFVNLLEPQDQKSLWERAQSIANNFGSDIPRGMSNLYRVDALPALRAKVKNDQRGLQSSGIINFEESLKKIVDTQQQRIVETRWPRLEVVISQVRRELQGKRETIESELRKTVDMLKTEVERGQELEQRYINGLKNSLDIFWNWLSGESLSRYISPAASALARGEFRSWETGPFKNDILERTRAIEKWVAFACEAFHKKNNTSLSIGFPADPDINLPRSPERLGGFQEFLDDIFNGSGIQREIDEVYSHNRNVAYHNGAVDYLQRFQSKAINTLNEYITTVAPLISFSGVEIPQEVKDKIVYLEALNKALNNLS
ncbi:dynamin family protein [Microcoleus anatoxicus]|uniref:Dynamin family protein n=1 Tax=Microcoleus anatoxicus PTRS2 TaxID=2705321 RepID=A0ABU8YSH0_9CYAN|nr:MAG: dynamin [Oscillatoriales cyanobacterium]